MFGYLTAFQPELRVRELDTYKAVYCGLCHCLRERYGLASSVGLSYDFALLAALGLALLPDEPKVRFGNCITHPLKKRAYLEETEALRYAAAVQVLLVCGKLEDDRADERGLRPICSATGLGILKSAYRKAARDYPLAFEAVSQELALQAEAESRQGESLDTYAHHNGRLLSRLVTPLGQDDTQKRVLEQLGYQLGRWVYLMDAADDWEKDEEKGRFNALRESGAFQKGVFDPGRALLLLQDASAAVSAALSLLPARRYLGILENVAGPGMAARQQAILAEKQREPRL